MSSAEAAAAAASANSFSPKSEEESWTTTHLLAAGYFCTKSSCCCCCCWGCRDNKISLFYFSFPFLSPSQLWLFNISWVCVLCVVIIFALTDWLPTTTTTTSFVSPSLYLCIVSAAAAAAPLFCFSFCTFCFVFYFVLLFFSIIPPIFANFVILFLSLITGGGPSSLLPSLLVLHLCCTTTLGKQCKSRSFKIRAVQQQQQQQKSDNSRWQPTTPAAANSVPHSFIHLFCNKDNNSRCFFLFCLIDEQTATTTCCTPFSLLLCPSLLLTYLLLLGHLFLPLWSLPLLIISPASLYLSLRCWSTLLLITTTPP